MEKENEKTIYSLLVLNGLWDEIMDDRYVDVAMNEPFGWYESYSLEEVINVAKEKIGIGKTAIIQCYTVEYYLSDKL